MIMVTNLYRKKSERNNSQATGLDCVVIKNKDRDRNNFIVS